jgi:hypothetical protein
MAVRDEDLLDLDPGLPDRFPELVEVAAGIDESRLVGFGAPQQSAILLESGDRHDRGLQRGIGSVHGSDVGKSPGFGKSNAAGGSGA